MARSPKSVQTASAPSQLISTSTPSTSTATPAAPASASASGAAGAVPAPTRTSSRRRQSVSTSTAPSTPLTPGPLTPADPAPSTPSSSAKPPPPSRQPVEAKAHALRSVLGQTEKVPCPFPGQYGGRDKCGIAEEDELDSVLMAICSACATMNNRALNPDEFAAIAFEHGWLRPPSAAVIPSTIIMNAIRTHMKRCEKADPPRRPLLAKHQLAGSVVESVLESALHPQAFAGSSRPKGTVYYLATVGKTKWKSPFDGIEVPKPPPRKPAPLKKSSAKENKESKESKDKKDSKKGKSKASAPVKIRLVLGAGLGQEDDELSDVGSSSQGSRSVSVSRSNSVTPSIANPLPISNATARIPRRVRDVLDSSSESDSSDSDMEVEAGPSRPSSTHRSHSYRKNPPPPIAITNSPRLSHLNRLPQASPFRELFFPPPLVSSAPSYNPPHSSPFPSHSLDNTTWAARNDNDRFASFETSSSSSDDEIRDPEWGNTSGILIRGADAAGAEGDDQPAWTAEDEEAKVKEATEALRVLFPMSSPDEEADMQPKIELNQLDNRVAASDTSSMAETSSTATAQAIFRGQVRGREASTVALAQWTVTSSPVPSPNLRHFAPLAPESSPTQHLSKLRSSFDPEEMDVDEEGPWLDESGELPVRAEDTFSDIDLGSTVGDAPTPEHDFRQKTAAWAREAAASTSFRVKDEPEDYPSPVTTDPDDQSAVLYRGSRASSTDASHTPSSGLSDLPPFEMDQDVLTRSDFVDFEEVIVGPESVTVEEIERWLPANKPEKTPRRGRDKNRHQVNRCSGNWGTIGVGGPFPAPTVKITPHAKTNASSAQNRSTRSTRGKKAAAPESPCVLKQKPVPSTPPAELDQETQVKVESETVEVDDAFGTADLEQARVEAEAREEQHRKACKAKAEQQKALLEAYREKMLAAHAIEGPDTMMWEQPTPSPWSDFGTTGPWCSNDSVQLVNPSALSPMVLHSVSALTIGDFPGVMDPRALLSPPILPGHGVQGMDELMPVYDLDQPKLAAPLPLPPMSAPAGPVAHMPPPPPMISSSAPPTVPATTPIVTTPVTADPPPPSPPAFSPALPTAPIPIPASPAAASSTPTVIVQPSSAPDVTPPQAAQKARAEAVGSSASTADASPAAPAAAPASASTAEAAPSGKASPTGSSSSSKSASTSQTPSTKPGLVLMPGVTATVLDNIPLYTHEPLSKSAVASQRVHCVCRRLDTDFVNATELLLALGVPFNRHSEFLTLPSPYLAAHTTMPTHGPNGIAHGPGVPGTWVHLNEAKEYVKRLKVEEGNLLLNLLRDDLFRRFAMKANFPPDHYPADTFGGPFIAGMAGDKGKAQSSNNSSSSGNGNSSLPASSANSRSTPNLTALGTSAPPRTATIPTKGPLVRSAPATPPDGCPHPKRRRATVVGESPLKTTTPMVLPGPGGPTPNGAAMTAAQKKMANMGSAAARRATRASVGGETPKPKVTK